MGLSDWQKMSSINNQLFNLGLPTYTEVSNALMQVCDGSSPSAIQYSTGLRFEQCEAILRTMYTIQDSNLLRR
jgi:hypothetical protein